MSESRSNPFMNISLKFNFNLFAGQCQIQGDERCQKSEGLKVIHWSERNPDADMIQHIK